MQRRQVILSAMYFQAQQNSKNINAHYGVMCVLNADIFQRIFVIVAVCS